MTAKTEPATVTSTINNVRINNQIIAPELRVVDEQGQNLGVMSREAAFKTAQERGSDLIEIAPMAKPPVARIMDFDKFRYQQEKAFKKQRANVKNQEVKQVQVSGRAAKNDLLIKTKKIEEFLAEGHLVNIVMTMRGREKGNKDWALQKLRDFLDMIPTPFESLSSPKLGPRGFLMTIKKK